jgi:DNA replication protein DnaC
LSLALGVEAVKAGRSVYFGTLADIIGALAKAEREGVPREKSATSQSFQAAAISSFSSSTLVTKRVP